MPISEKTTALRIEVVPASPEQQPVLANLLELYAHDFSEHIEMELDEQGRFGYASLPLYWKESGRHPFIIRVNNQLAGFVFVRKGSQVSADENVWDVAEFFVLRRYRRHGIGLKAAHDVWKKFKGRWEVRVMNRNQQARDFWNRAVNEFNGTTNSPRAYEKHGERWSVFSFES